MDATTGSSDVGERLALLLFFSNEAGNLAPEEVRPVVAELVSEPRTVEFWSNLGVKIGTLIKGGEQHQCDAVIIFIHEIRGWLSSVNDSSDAMTLDTVGGILVLLGKVLEAPRGRGLFKLAAESIAEALAPIQQATQTLNVRISNAKDILIEHLLFSLEKQAYSPPATIESKEDKYGVTVRVGVSSDPAATTAQGTTLQSIAHITSLYPVEASTHLSQQLSDVAVSVAPGQMDFDWLSGLCEAASAMSGKLELRQEKVFLVRFIKNLLGLVEVARGKDAKGKVATGIMRVTVSFPRFLLQHWRFLKVVVLKLMEFMHEQEQEIVDMACKSFATITKDCGSAYLETQPNEPKPFIGELVDSILTIMSSLDDFQARIVLESLYDLVKSEQGDLVSHLRASDRAVRLLRLSRYIVYKS